MQETVLAFWVFYAILNGICHRRTSQRSASAQRPTDSSFVLRRPPEERSSLAAATRVAQSSRSNPPPMLQKRSRLTKHDIEELKHARRSKSAHFLVIYGFSSTSQAAKAAFSASKKVAKTAVLRNRLRRRGYAAIKPLLGTVSDKSLILIS